LVLVWIAAAAIAGILLGQALILPPFVGLILLALILLSALLCWRRDYSKGLIVAAALVIGLARSPHQVAPSPGEAAFYNGSTVQLVGVVDTEPDIRDTGANYVVAIHELVRGNRHLSLTGRVAIHTTRAIQLDYGDQVSVVGKLLTPRNSSKLPWADILAAQGIRSQMSFPRLLDLGPTSTGPLGWLVSLRQYLEKGINAWLPEPEAALLIAITLGAKSSSLGDLAPALVSTGLIHLVAISGIKVALIAGIIHQLARRSGNRLAALTLGLLATWSYVLLTGATASGLRAAIMWTLVFVASFLGRQTVVIVSLSFAAALMVLLNPSLLWDTGFQLSMFGTFYIVALSSPIERLINRLFSPFREAFAVTLAAQLGTLPIVIWGFHVISLQGSLTNALVLPLLPVLIVLGFLVGSFGNVPVLVAPLASLAYALTHAIVMLAKDLAPLAAPSVSLPFAVGVAYYVVLTAVSIVVLRRMNWVPFGRRPHLKREFAFASLFGLSALSVSFLGLRSDAGTHLYWLGSGNAFLLRSGSQVALIDGSPHPFALMERLGELIPFNQHSIDVLILTDPRSSNATGVEELLKHYSIGEVLDVGAEYPTTTYSRWRSDLARLHVPAYALRTGASVKVGDANILSMGPDALYSNPADCVGLLKVTIAGRTWLLLGKSSTREQTESLFRPVQLRSDGIVTLGKRPLSGFLQSVGASKLFGAWNLPASSILDLSKS
jgi:competence protein ComEC